MAPAPKPGPVQPPTRRPQVGDTVLYEPTSEERSGINRRRARAAHAPDSEWGFQAHAGARAEVDDVFPAIVVRVLGADTDAPEVRLQVFLDGNDVLWVKGCPEGDSAGQWSWPRKD
jgi:hypothetical protein